MRLRQQGLCASRTCLLILVIFKMLFLHSKESLKREVQRGCSHATDSFSHFLRFFFFIWDNSYCLGKFEYVPRFGFYFQLHKKKSSSSVYFYKNDTETGKENLMKNCNREIRFLQQFILFSGKFYQDGSFYESVILKKIQNPVTDVVNP